MSKVIAGKLRDLKSLRDPKGVFGMKARGGQQNEKEVTGHADRTVILVIFWGEASLELLFWGQLRFPTSSVLNTTSTLSRQK